MSQVDRKAPVISPHKGDLIIVNRAGQEPATARVVEVHDHGDGTITIHLEPDDPA